MFQVLEHVEALLLRVAVVGGGGRWRSAVRERQRQSGFHFTPVPPAVAARYVGLVR